MTRWRPSLLRGKRAQPLIRLLISIGPLATLLAPMKKPNPRSTGRAISQGMGPGIAQRRERERQPDRKMLRPFHPHVGQFELAVLDSN